MEKHQGGHTCEEENQQQGNLEFDQKRDSHRVVHMKVQKDG